MISAPMALALGLARAAGEGGEVPVGAVIIDPGTGATVATSSNAPIELIDPTAHAEIGAIRTAAQIKQNYRLTGLHMYVTLEPCAMCAGAISLARLGKVIFAASDPKGGAVISGPRYFEQPTCHWRPEVEQEVAAEEEAAALLRTFFKARRSKA